MDVDRLVQRFDHHDPQFSRDPAAVYRGLRATCPIARTDAWGGYWVVSRYADIAAIARDHETFSSASGVTIPGGDAMAGDDGGMSLAMLGDEFRLIPIECDPPSFYRYRHLLNAHFSPARVEAMEPELRALTGSVIDELIARGEWDFVTDFAMPIPARTVLRVVGADPDEWATYVSAVHYALHRMLQARAAGDEELSLEKIMVLLTGIGTALAERRAEPDAHDDLITALIAAGLNDLEIVGTCWTVIFGGLDTTTAAIGNTLHYLGTHPDVRQRLVDHPELLGTAIEEFLRYFSPIQGLGRTVTRACERGGTRFEEGEKVFLVWASGNRDESEFADPDELVVDRAPNRHMTFGMGLHRCLGSHLARLEMRVTLEEVLRRIPDYTVDEAAAHRYDDVGIAYGFETLPARLTCVGASR